MERWEEIMKDLVDRGMDFADACERIADLEAKLEEQADKLNCWQSTYDQLPDGFDIGDDATTELAVKCAGLTAERNEALATADELKTENDYFNEMSGAAFDLACAARKVLDETTGEHDGYTETEDALRAYDAVMAKPEMDVETYRGVVSENEKLKGELAEARGLLQECKVKLVDASDSVVPKDYACYLLKRVSAELKAADAGGEGE